MAEANIANSTQKHTHVSMPSICSCICCPALLQVVRQQELLYNVEFQLQQMERKVARAGGVGWGGGSRSMLMQVVVQTVGTYSELSCLPPPTCNDCMP
jgi:hypothetical protein